MSVGAAFVAMAVGAGLVGLWCVVRFPRFLAWSLPSGIYALGLVCLLLAALAPLAGAAMHHLGVRAALLGVVFPTLTVVVWAIGCVIRVAIDPPPDAS